MSTVWIDPGPFTFIRMDRQPLLAIDLDRDRVRIEALDVSLLEELRARLPSCDDRLAYWSGRDAADAEEVRRQVAERVKQERLWRKNRQMALARDKGECQDCDTKPNSPAVHHIFPKEWGGSHDMTNLVTLCEPCHRSRHKKLGRRPPV